MTLAKRLEATRPLLLDGGIGSEIKARGYPLHPSVWSALAHLEDAELVAGIHRDYLASGAEVITANTFSLSRHNLEHAGFGDVFAKANARATQLARAAVDERRPRQAWVAGSLSTIPPMDAPDRLAVGRAAYQNYKLQAEILKDNGADLILAEMLLEEQSATCLMDAACSVGLPVWSGVSAMIGPDAQVMGFRAPGKYKEVPSTVFADLVLALASYPVELIAVMHTKVDVVPSALSVLRQLWDGPIAAYAETGLSGDSDWFFETALGAQDYATIAAKWVDTCRLDAVGGCCGTRPAHIAALAKQLTSG